jgi:hypothetical protein
MGSIAREQILLIDERTELELVGAVVTEDLMWHTDPEAGEWQVTIESRPGAKIGAALLDSSGASNAGRRADLVPSRCDTRYRTEYWCPEEHLEPVCLLPAAPAA